jgi:RNA recognition motif-containing protein
MRANDRRRHPTNCRVFIGNIDPSVTTEEIERIFEK